MRSHGIVPIRVLALAVVVTLCLLTLALPTYCLATGLW